MEVNKKQNGDVITLSPVGNIDYESAPELDSVIEKCSSEADQIILDLKGVSYISSAGLRILLNADELMADKGGLVIKGVTPDVMEVLTMTGFAEALNIEG